MISRKLLAAGISAIAMTPSVALACTGSGHAGYPATGATGATGSTGWSGVTNASAHHGRFRVAHHAHSRKHGTRV